jgi:RNA polymerase sigma-70 factor (ECF subfamily)
VLTIQPEAVLEEQIGSAPAVDEADLIRAAQRGDQDAFEQLVRAYDQGVLRLALNLLRNPDDARDVYQEAFLRAYRNLHGFRFDCSFQTWISRIATNVCLDQLRRRKVRREEPAVAASGDGHFDRTKEVPERSADGDPQRQLLSKELSDRIRQVLEGFTPRERTVFELRHFEGLRLKAIGELLGTTEEAAKNCLFRVTQKMRTALGDFV